MAFEESSVLEKKTSCEGFARVIKCKIFVAAFAAKIVKSTAIDAEVATIAAVVAAIVHFNAATSAAVMMA
jgi:hypothetical protein